jgi:hypothetical protein
MKEVVVLRSVTAAALILTAIATACPASADSADDQYVAAAQGLGIDAPVDQLINAGHRVCNAWGNGYTDAMTLPLVAAGVPRPQVRQMITAAGQAYCPAKLSVFGVPTLWW